MNPITGTVQTLENWHLQKDTSTPESSNENELVEERLVNDQWVRVNGKDYVDDLAKPHF
jgi:hypothetical protein